MRRLTTWVVTLTCALTASQAHPEDWPTHLHDVAHTARTSESFNPAALQYRWSAPQGHARPVIVGDNVISMRSQQGDLNGTSSIRSFRLADGHVNWTYTARYAFPSSVAHAQGLVVYAATDPDTFTNRLYVHDANTGALKYSVPITERSIKTPTLHRNPTTGQLTAYLTDGINAQAVDLGPASGSVRWTKSGSFGSGNSVPTIVGNSLILAGPDHYYALALADGTMNQFHNGTVSGGGGSTVAYDAARNQFYVMSLFNGLNPRLTAYAYQSNSSITQRWQKSGAGVVDGASVAIAADGKLYSLDRNTIVERDPVTGDVLRSLPGQDFSAGATPILSNGHLWTFNDDLIQIFDLQTLLRTKTLGDSPLQYLQVHDVPGVLGNGHFVLDYGPILDSPGFDVYVVPEPTALLLLLPLATTSLLARHRHSTHKKRVAVAPKGRLLPPSPSAGVPG